MGLVKVFLPTRDFSHETSATTWGDLRRELISSHDVSFGNMKAVCGNDKSVFELDSTPLPTFDGKYQFSLMLLQAKSDKGGLKSMVKAIYKKIVKEESPCPPPLKGDELEEAYLADRNQAVRAEWSNANSKAEEHED